MASNLFDAVATETPDVPKVERRVKLFSYDAVAAQLLQPFGESNFDTLSLQQLWKATSDGNKQAAYHSHLCTDKVTDPWRVGAGVSTTAAALQAAVKNLETDDMKRLIRPELYEKNHERGYRAEAHFGDAEHWQRFPKAEASGSTMRQAKRAKVGSSTVHAYTEAEVLEATKKFHAWLSQEKSALRGALFVLSGNNSYYTGHVAEVVARACIQFKPLSAADMVTCMRARLTKPAESEGSKKPGTDSTGLFD